MTRKLAKNQELNGKISLPAHFAYAQLTWSDRIRTNGISILHLLPKFSNSVSLKTSQIPRAYASTNFTIFEIVNNAQRWDLTMIKYALNIFQLICVKKMVCKWFIFISILTLFCMFIFFQTFYHISLHGSVTRRKTFFILCKSGSLYSPCLLNVKYNESYRYQRYHKESYSLTLSYNEDNQI